MSRDYNYEAINYFHTILNDMTEYITNLEISEHKETIQKYELLEYLAELQKKINKDNDLCNSTSEPPYTESELETEMDDDNLLHKCIDFTIDIQDYIYDNFSLPIGEFINSSNTYEFLLSKTINKND